MRAVEVVRLVADEGSVLLFEGVVVESGDAIVFASDRRPGVEIVEALGAAVDAVVAVVPDYLVVAGPTGGVPALA